MNNVKKKIKQLLDTYPKWLLSKEYTAQKFNRFNERSVEYSFIFRQITILHPRMVLDVGTGRSALPSLMRSCGCLVTAIDNIRDYWSTEMLNNHYHVINDDITQTQLQSQFDLITCVSVLEHIKQPDKAINNMLTLLKPGGHLVLTFPYSEQRYIENVYKLPNSSYGQDASYICQSYSREELDRWFRNGNSSIVEQEYLQYWDGDFWTSGNQIIPPFFVDRTEKHQLTCLLVRKNK